MCNWIRRDCSLFLIYHLWTIIEAFIEFVTILFLFLFFLMFFEVFNFFGFFWLQGIWILAPTNNQAYTPHTGRWSQPLDCQVSPKGLLILISCLPHQGSHCLRLWWDSLYTCRVERLKLRSMVKSQVSCPHEARRPGLQDPACLPHRTSPSHLPRKSSLSRSLSKTSTSSSWPGIDVTIT